MFKNGIERLRANMSRTARYLQDNVAQTALYLREGREYIADTNLRMLRATTMITLVVSLLFFIISPRLVTNWSLTIEYWMLVPLTAGFFVWSLCYGRKEKRNSRAVMGACVAYNVLLFWVFIAISVFPYPDSRELFVGVWLLTMPVLFKFSPLFELAITFSSSAIFCVLATACKTREAIEFDIFSVLFTFILSWAIWGMQIHMQSEAYLDKQKLISASRNDWLTGILNKQSFEKHCFTFYKNASGKPTAFAMLDVDNFKRINDEYGHETGDRVLQCVSRCLKSSLAPDDVTGRVGGDEFAMLLMDIDSEEQLERILKRVTTNIAAKSKDAVENGVTASVGCVLIPAGVSGYAGLYQNADKLMYQAKQSGKNRVIIQRYRDAEA